MSDGNTELRRLLARSHARAGMVIDGVEHRVKRNGVSGKRFCYPCLEHWPCSAVKVEALKRAVVKVWDGLGSIVMDGSTEKEMERAYRQDLEAELAQARATVTAQAAVIDNHLDADVNTLRLVVQAMVRHHAEHEAENAAMLDKAKDCIGWGEASRCGIFKGDWPTPEQVRSGLAGVEERLRQRNEEYLRRQRAGRQGLGDVVVGTEGRKAACGHGTTVTGTISEGRSTTWCPRCGMVYAHAEASKERKPDDLDPLRYY